MKVVDVIPLVKSVGKETFSYFSARPVELGSLVRVPMRNKIIPAIVVAIHDASKLKAQLKSSDYKLRNVASVESTSPFNPAFLKTCINVKNYYATTTGALLAAYTPKILIEHLNDFNFQKPVKAEHRTDLLPERSIFQASFDDRMSYYKTLAREQFAGRKSLYICTPTQAHADALFLELSKGIENRTLVLHSGITKKKLIQTIQEVQDGSQAVLVIGTAHFLLLARPQVFSTVVTEFEGSEHYRRQVRPYLDTRDFIYTYAYLSGMSFIAADELIQVNTLYRSEKEYFSSIKPTHFTIKKNVGFEFIYPEEKEFESKTYPFLAKKTLTTIEKALIEKGTIIIFTPRKGLAPLSVCQDCGTVVVDPQDQKTPLVLYEKTTSKGVLRFYQNPRTGKKFETVDACATCDGWRIKTLGISTQSMKQYLEKVLKKKNTPIYIIDGTETTTALQTKKVINQWQVTSGILITTEKSLPYLIHYKAHTTILASIESLLASSVYTAHERLARLILSFADSTLNNFIIQTRDTLLPVLDSFKKKNLSDWYKNEIHDRLTFAYPPFGMTIKIETVGTKDAIDKRNIRLSKLFDTLIQTRHIYKDKKTKEQNYRLVITMMISVEDWISLPAQKNIPTSYIELFDKLQSLPVHFKVYINPARLL